MDDRAGRDAKRRAGRLASSTRGFRCRVRSLILLVAIAGLAGGALVESDNRRRRDRFARGERDCLDQAARHEREAQACRAALGRGEPYNPMREANVFRTDIEESRSWGEELHAHEDAASRYRQEAARRTRLRRYYEGRLLLGPF